MKINKSDKIIKLSNEEIADVIDSIRTFFTDLKIDNRSVLRVILPLEESLLRWQEYFGQEKKIQVSIQRRFFRYHIKISLEGPQINPLIHKDDGEYADILTSVLSGHGSLPAYQYRNGSNILIISPERKKNTAVSTIAFCLLGLLCGFASKFLPEQVQTELLNVIVDPCCILFVNLLKMISVPLIFTSIVTGTIMGMSSEKAKSDAVLSTRAFILNSVLTTCFFTLLMICYFGIDFNKGHFNFDFIRIIIEKIYSFLPNNLFSPFLSGNMIQLLLLALFFGFLLSETENTFSTLKSGIIQLNILLKKALDRLFSLIDLFLFFTILHLFLVPQQDIIFQFISPILCCAVMYIIMSIGWLFFYSVKTKTKISAFLIPMLPTLKTMLITSNRWPALAQVQQYAQRTLNVPANSTQQLIPLGFILNNPALGITLIIIVFFLAQYQGLTITIDWVIIAVIFICLLMNGNSYVVLISILFPQLGINNEGMLLAISLDPFFGRFRIFPDVFSVVFITACCCNKSKQKAPDNDSPSEMP